MKVKFPKYNKDWDSKESGGIQYHRYYNIHFKYILNILKYCNIDIELVNPEYFSLKHKTAFEIEIDDNLVLIDFSDFESLSITEISKYKAVFKFHYNSETHNEIINVFPISPVNFHEWPIYYEYVNDYKYRAKGKIYNQQSPAGRAYDRRHYVRNMLIEKYGNDFVYERCHRYEFYKNVSKCLVSVCVPGARNNMLDRGHGQYMLLGACTISPKLVTTLSYGLCLEPGVHYIECKEDYSDLIDKIEWCKRNRGECMRIGKTAKKIMQETSTPERQIEWIKTCLGYGKYSSLEMSQK